MARTVYVPEAGGALSFADGTTDQQIVDFVRAKYAPAPAPAPPEAGIGALTSGLYGTLGRVEAAGGKAAQGLGIDSLADYLFTRSRADEAYANTYKPDVADISQIKGVGDVASFAGSTIAQSAPETAIGVGGAYAGALAGGAIGSAVPVVGTAVGATIGGLIGGAMAALPSFVGGNLQRQVQEQGTTLENASGYGATAGAVVQAPLDAAFDTLIARKFPGAGAALDVAKKGFFKEVAATAAKGAATEALTEPAQQAIEIAQANPDKLLEFGPDVQNEILTAAAGGALAGGIIGGGADVVGGMFEGRQKSQEEQAKVQLEADIKTATQRGEQMKKMAEINSGIEKLSQQNVIGQLKLGKVRIDPTPANGLKAPIERFQILDAKNNSIAEFSDPVNATDAVNNYSRVSGKKINLLNLDTGKIQPITPVKGPEPTTVQPLEKAQFPQTKPVTIPGANPPPVTPKIPKKMAEAIKKADIATRLQPLAAEDIPYDTLTWDDNKNAPVPSSGKSKVLDFKDRKIVVVNVNGVRVPFYLSSGLGGKANVPSGKWYPFFGIGADGWVNKTSQGEMANYYGDEDLKRVAQTLDATVGDIRKDNTIPKIGLNGAHLSFINSGLAPAENQNADTLEKVNRNIKTVLDKIRANRPVQEPVAQAALLEAPVVGMVERTAGEVAPAVAEPIAPIAPIAPNNPEFDTEAAPPVVDQAAQEAVRQFISGRKKAIATGVQEALKKYNLKDVQTKFTPAFMDSMGKVRAVEGTEMKVGDKSIVTLATNIYDPKLTTEEMVNRVVSVLDHEAIHSLFDLGLLRPQERAMLLNAAETAKKPGKNYTYLDYAKAVYDPSKPGLEIYSNPELIKEEAIAEMFRDWRKNNNGAPKEVRGLINRVIDALRHMFNVMRRSKYEDVFEAIKSGEVGGRKAAPKIDGKEVKFAVAPALDTDEFEQWFGDSKVVNKDGSPKIVYHGTSRTGKSAKMFSDNPLIAEDYARFPNVDGGMGPSVVEAYLSLKNPVPESEMRGFDPESVLYDDGWVEYQKSKGYDGYVFSDLGSTSGRLGGLNYVVFDTNQVARKSVKKLEEMQNTSGFPKFSMAPENPRLSVAPVYPFGQQVPEVNAAQINNTLDHITYGAGVDMLDRVMRSRTMSTVIPERWRPSKDRYTAFIQNFMDKMLPVGQMIDYIKKNGGTVPDAFDAYMAEELMHGKVSDSLEARENEMYKPMMEYIRDSGLSQQEFEDYLYARHAEERNAYIRSINPNADESVGSGMPDEEARSIIAAVNASPNRDAFLAAENMFRAIIEDTNRLRAEAGLTPDFSVPMLDENGNEVPMPNFQNYAPLRGFADESHTEGEVEEETRARIGQGFKIRGREDMRAMGRTSKATDILAHAMLQNTEAVIRSAKNKVGQTFLNLVEANPELANDYGVEVLVQGKKPLKRYISSKGVVKTMVDPMYKNSDDVMVVKRNGEEIPIRIDNRFLQKALLAKKSGSPDGAEKIMNFLQRANRFMAAMRTVYNPEFMLVNFPRDLQTAMVNITQYEIDGIQKKVLKDALPAVKSVYQILRNPETQNEWSEWYKMFKQDGGATSGFFGTFTLEDRLRKLDTLAQDVSGQPSQRIKTAFDFVKTILEDANGAFENATRLSVYKNLVEAGLSRERAAQAAKNLTVNFDKRGSYGPVINSLYMFYNASVQGTMSMGMAMARSKKVRKVVAGIVVVGMLQDMINSLMSDRDDDGALIYDKLPDYKLESNMLIMDPFGMTKNGFFAVPLPYGFNAFYNLGRSLSRTARGGYKSSEAITSIGSTFLDAFNPVGGTESFLNFMAPTILDPIVALSLNQDYTGRKIYPESFPGSVPKADSQMYWSTTSPIFKTTADYLNWMTGGSEYVPGMVDVSPDVLEYMFDYALGGVGTFVRRSYDTATSTVPAAMTGDLENIDINNIPFFRKMYGNVSEKMTFEDYFNKVNHVLARGEEMKSAMRDGDPERIKSVRARFSDELSIYPAVKALANKRNRLASELKKLKSNTKMPPEQKRRRQEVIQKQIEDVTNRVNSLYENKIGNKYPSFLS